MSTLIRNIQEGNLKFCSAQLSWHITVSLHTSSDHMPQQEENWLSDLEIWLCDFGQYCLTFLSGFQVLIFSYTKRSVGSTFSSLTSLPVLSLHFCHHTFIKFLVSTSLAYILSVILSQGSQLSQNEHEARKKSPVCLSKLSKLPK